MKRRRLLTTLGVAMTALGGCANFTPAEPTPADATSTADATPDAEPGCPPYAPELDGIVCSHTVDTNTETVYLLPSTTEAESADTVDLTLHNDSETALTFNPYSWTIFERRDSGWERFDRQSSGSGKLTVDPGATHVWPFAAVLTYFEESGPLEPGEYAAEISVPDPGGSDWVRLVAVFELGGPVETRRG